MKSPTNDAGDNGRLDTSTVDVVVDQPTPKIGQHGSVYSSTKRQSYT